MSNFYKNSEKITEDTVKKTLGKFNKARLDLMKTDELNVPQVTEEIGELYDSLLDETKKGLQKIKDDVEGEENKPSTLSVEEYLEDFNPLLMYVPLNETVRKRERYIENILALTLAIGKVGSSEGLNTSDMLSTQKKAVRLWNTQMTEAFADFERETRKSCWENDGVEYVRWIAQDGACGYCDELNGQVFVLGDEPPLQHINCRCELEPVEKNEDID